MEQYGTTITQPIDATWSSLRRGVPGHPMSGRLEDVGIVHVFLQEITKEKNGEATLWCAIYVKFDWHLSAFILSFHENVEIYRLKLHCAL